MFEKIQNYVCVDVLEPSLYKNCRKQITLLSYLKLKNKHNQQNEVYIHINKKKKKKKNGNKGLLMFLF